MKVVIQRVKYASVEVDGVSVGEIDQGLLAFVAVEKNDDEAKADKMLEKIINYRVFSDSEGKMNLSLKDIKGGLLLVSQFTLAADTQKGLRPSFSSAAKPELAKDLYHFMIDRAVNIYPQTQSGIFAADMQINLLNDGPVTFILENK